MKTTLFQSLFMTSALVKEISEIQKPKNLHLESLLAILIVLTIILLIIVMFLQNLLAGMICGTVSIFSALGTSLALANCI